MGIKEVKVSIGITVNLGDDESIRLDVSLTADMTEQEWRRLGLLELADTARKELAYQLWDMAEAKLSTYGLADMAEDEREAYAREHCPEFRHMLMLHPDAARELLGAVVEGAEFDDKAKLNENDQRRSR